MNPRMKRKTQTGDKLCCTCDKWGVTSLEVSIVKAKPRST